MGIYDRDYYQGDEFRPLRPWDNKSMVTLLIIANAAVYLADLLFTGSNHNLLRAMTLVPSDLVQPLNWYHLLTYGFAHDPGNIWHLIFNMASLYFLGRSVEDKYGKWEFFRIYMLSIFLCGVVWCAMRLVPGSEAQGGAVLGASGAVTTIIMLFVFSFPQSTLYVYGAIPVKAWVLGIVVVGMNVFGGSDGVAYDVHLVGAGLAAIYFFGGIHLGFLSTDFAKTWKTKLRQQRRGLKVHRADAEEPVASREEIEADRILDKIHREGQASLTRREQQFMEQYSRRVREQRKGN